MITTTEQKCFKIGTMVDTESGERRSGRKFTFHLYHSVLLDFFLNSCVSPARLVRATGTERPQNSAAEVLGEPVVGAHPPEARFFKSSWILNTSKYPIVNSLFQLKQAQWLSAAYNLKNPNL